MIRKRIYFIKAYDTVDIRVMIRALRHVRVDKRYVHLVDNITRMQLVLIFLQVPSMKQIFAIPIAILIFNAAALNSHLMNIGTIF